MTKNKRETVLISVFDKSGISKFAKTLKNSGYTIIATEGTGKELSKNQIPYIPALKISKNPEGLNDCVKTISFHIEAGILFDRLNPIHIKQAKKLGVEKIDIVVCNFVTFEKVIRKPSDFNIKNIDVGGPLMVRAAATNFKHVLVVVDPNDYQKVAKSILEDKVTDNLKQKLAAKAFNYTRSYDQTIAKYLKNTKFVKNV